MLFRALFKLTFRSFQTHFRIIIESRNCHTINKVSYS